MSGCRGKRRSPKEPKRDRAAFCANFTAALSLNADGIDIDSTQDALVEDNHLSVGDDALCVKSGVGYFGRAYGRPAKDILFRRNTIGAGNGITSPRR